MREVTKILQLKKGLRRDYRFRRNSDELYELFNAEVTENGVTKLVAIENALSVGVISAAAAELEWPFPQIIRGNKYSFLCGKTRVDLIQESDWTTLEVPTYNAMAKDTEKSISIGGVWQLCDFHDSWLLTNGVSTVFHTKDIFNEPDKVYVQDSIPVNACCAFRGRAVLAGFDSDNFWNNAWRRFFEDWGNRKGLNIPTYEPLGENFVWWSTVGGGDMLWLFDTNLLLGGKIDGTEYSYDKPLIFDYWQRNESGFMPMNWRGAVYQVRPLGKGLMVYGQNGMTFLFPTTEPFSTLGRQDIFNQIGLASRGAVSGNESNHVCVDGSGVIWRITEKGPEKLGYQEYMVPLLGTEIIVSYTEENNTFYIGGSDRTFKLTQFGLSKLDQIITSVFVAEGETKGFCNIVGDNDSEVRIVTDTLDFGVRGEKTVTQINIPVVMDVDAAADWYVCIYYRYDKKKTFVQTEWRALNKKGWIRFQVSAVEFMIGVKATNYVETDVPESISINIAYTDKSSLRSQNVSENATRISS